MHTSDLQVLHLAPHVGGGVGSVLLDWLRNVKPESAIKHSIACLDECQPESRAILKKSNLMFHENLYRKERNLLWRLISQADIVLLHYWNNPLLARLLIEEGLPLSRLVCWCHISGLNEPCIIPSFLIDVCDRVIFSSPASKISPLLKRYCITEPDKLGVVHSRRNLEPFSAIANSRLIRRRGSSLLYVGTVAYSKLHSAAESILGDLSRAGFDITVVGGPEHLEIEKRLCMHGTKVNLTGPIPDVRGLLAESDIFIYPLSPTHYGTGEQAILEAMASGLPVIAFNNPAESVLIKDLHNGCLVSTHDEFVQETVGLAESLELRTRLSCNAANDIRHKFIDKSLNEEFNAIFESSMRHEKSQRKIKGKLPSKDPALSAFILTSIQSESALKEIMNSSSEEELLNAVAHYIRLQMTSGRCIWRSSTKGSPQHYAMTFPESSMVYQLLQLLT